MLVMCHAEMNRHFCRFLLVIALVSLGAMALPEHSSGRQTQQRLNVLFIAIDDLRPELGCYSSFAVDSPNIDGLAASGMRFDRAYCQYPLCNPSRTSLLTGRLPTTTGVMDNLAYFRQTMPDLVTLPQHFRANGYVTARTGKIFHGGIDDERSWVEGGEPLQPRQPMTPEQQQQRVRNADRWVAVEGSGEEQPDYRTASRAVELMEKYRDQPFFLAVGFVKPHVPLIAPKRYFDLYDPTKITLPSDFAPRPQVTAGVPPQALSPNGDLFINREATPEEARQAIAAYYACVSWMDAQVGRVLAALDQMGLREKTIVVFFGDHGWHLGEKGKWSKHNSLYEIGTRVPLIIDSPLPEHRAGVSTRTVELLALYPTLVDLCGLPQVAGLEGTSLRPLLAGQRSGWSDKPARTVTRRGNVMGKTVRFGRYRYTEWAEGSIGAELYDHTRDPGETRNLVNDPQFAQEVMRLKQLLPRMNQHW